MSLLIQKLISYTQLHWTLIAGLCGASAAFVVFLKESLTVAKLTREIIALKQQSAENEAKAKSMIVTPSAEEIYRYGIQSGLIEQEGMHSPILKNALGPGVIFLLGTVLTAIASALGLPMWSFLWQAAIVLLLAGLSYFFGHFMLVWLARLKSTRADLKNDVLTLYRDAKGKACKHQSSTSTTA